MFRLKAKVLLWGLALVFFAGSSGKAQEAPRDLVLLIHDSGQAPRADLLLALRIQLTGAAQVDAHAVPLPTALPARIEAASSLAQERGALAVLWIDAPSPNSPGTSQEAVLYVVARDRERALLEVVRVAGRDGSEMDRSLAIKAREVVDQLRASRASADEAPQLMLSPPPEVERDRARWGATALLGALVAPLDGASVGQWGAHIAVGPRWGTGAWRLLGMASLTVLPRVAIERADAVVGIAEIVPGIAWHAQLLQGPLWLGAHAGFGLSFLAADGRAADGSTGEADHRLPSLQFGAEAELPLAAGLGLSLSAELQARTRRQRFAIENHELVDLGMFRPRLQLALTWTAGVAP